MAAPCSDALEIRRTSGNALAVPASTDRRGLFLPCRMLSSLVSAGRLFKPTEIWELTTQIPSPRLSRRGAPLGRAQHDICCTLSMHWAQGDLKPLSPTGNTRDHAGAGSRLRSRRDAPLRMAR